MEVKVLQWQEMDPETIVTIYRNILNRIQDIADQTLERGHHHNLMSHFLASLSLDGMQDLLEGHSYQRLYRMFFYDWLLLDYRSQPGSSTMAELTWQHLKGSLNQAEEQALTNLIKSYVSLYRIYHIRKGQAYLENLIMPRAHYKIPANNDSLMAGDVLVARLLPGPSNWLLLEPWIILLPLNEKLLSRSLLKLMKEAGYNKRNFKRFCKKKTVLLLKLVNQEVVEAGKDMAAIAENIPFCPDWMEATIDDYQRTMDLLKTGYLFPSMNEIGDGGFLFYDRENPSGMSWGYILLENDRIAVCVPPHEDPSSVLEALNRVIAEPGGHLEFTKIEDTRNEIIHNNNRIVADLSRFLQCHEDWIDDILIPRQYTHCCQEQSRSDFFAKLSLLVGKQIQQDKRSAEDSSD